MKKLISLLAVLALCLGMCAPAFAKEGISVNAKLTYTVSERCYIDSEGNLWMWGENEYGQCGLDPSVTKWLDEPRLVMSKVAAVRRAKEAVIVLKTDGTAWTWAMTSTTAPQSTRSTRTGRSFTITLRVPSHIRWRTTWRP